MPYTFYCNGTDGLKYTAFISGTDLSAIQTNSTETAIKYKTNALTVNNDGVSVRSLALSYIYDNGLTGSSRILSELSSGPEYVTLTVNKNVVSSYIGISPTELDHQR